MPYVLQQYRDRPPETAGDLNYRLCKAGVDGAIEHTEFRAILDEFQERMYPNLMSYTIINLIVGAAFGAILETNRRFNGGADFTPALGRALYEWYADVAGPYEDDARKRNGDVFPSTDAAVQLLRP